MCKPIRHLTIVSVVVSKAHPEKRQPAKMLLLSTIETYLWDAIRVEQGRGCFLEGQPESALIGILKHLKQWRFAFCTLTYVVALSDIDP